MRTVIAPLAPPVAAQLAALDARLAEIARRYIRRLALEPHLGAPVSRGPLAAFGVRRVYFDARLAPGDLLRSRAPAARRGDQDLAAGPRWRIFYWAQEAPSAGVRLIVVLAIGDAHPRDRQPSAYELGWTTLSSLLRREAMTAYLVARPAYHRGMDDGLPHPTEALTLVEIERVIAMLEHGGAVIVLSNDREQRLGVLTRDPTLLGDAHVAQLIDAGHLPPIGELLALDDRDELP